MTVAEHLMRIALAIIDVDIDDVTRCIIDGQQHRIDESFVGREVQTLITGKHLSMDGGIDLNGITLHQLTGCLIVALTLDALDL